MKHRHNFKLLLFSFLCFIFVISNCVFFASWTINREVPAEDIVDIPVEEGNAPICYIYNESKNKDVDYLSVSTALKEAESGDYIYIYKNTNPILVSTNLEINSGVHLVLPFVGKAKKTDNISPLYKVEKVDNYKNYGSTQGDANITSVSKYRFASLEMGDGCDITINSGGFLHVGGVYYTSGNYGNYSEITLSKTSFINVYGTLDCYGYIKQTYSSATKILSRRSETNKSHGIVAHSGSVVNSLLCMYDALSGGKLATAIPLGVSCFFWTYDFAAIQVPFMVNFKSTFNAYSILTVGTNNAEGMAIVASSGTNSMFKLDDESSQILFDYTPPTINNILYTNKTNAVSNIFINGNVSFESIKITAGTQTCDTSTFYIPLSYKQQVYVEDGANFTINSQVKGELGTSLTINTGGKLIINSNVGFFTKDAVAISSTTSPYSKTRDDALIINNGTITVSATGKLGSKIIHNNNTATLSTVDFSQVSSFDSLQFNIIDDADKHTIGVKSDAYFKDSEDAIVKLGAFQPNASYNSGYIEKTSEEEEDEYYWTGEFVALVELIITVTNKSYDYKFSDYSLYYNDTASSSGQSISAENVNVSTTYTFNEGTYIQYQAPDVESSAIIIDGENIAYDANSWFQLNSGGTITIEPSEGALIAAAAYGTAHKYYNGKQAVVDANVNTGATQNTDSGAGTTVLNIYTSTSSNGTFTNIASGSSGFVSAIVRKNATYFRINCSQRGTNNKLGTIEFKGCYYYLGLNNSSNRSISNYDPSNSTQWQSATNTFSCSASALHALTFGFYGPDSCLLPSSQIKMADGTAKNAGDVRQGDMVKVFNHENGMIENAPIFYNFKYEAKEVTVCTLSFANGSNIEISGDHGFFSKELNKYVYINDGNAQEYVGQHFYYLDNDTLKTSELIDFKIEERYTDLYCPVSTYHLNYFVEDYLSMPGGISGCFNIFDYDDNLQYNQEAMGNDISTYGLMSYDECKEYIPEEVFNSLPMKYMKVAIGKGLLSFEQLKYYMTHFYSLMS